MPKHTKSNRRGGDKKKTLFRTTSTKVTVRDSDPPEIQKKDFEALQQIINTSTFTAFLDDLESKAAAIIEENGYLDDWDNIAIKLAKREINKYDLPLPVSYAADILGCVYKLRKDLEHIPSQYAKIAEWLILTSYDLGSHVTCLLAETAVIDREGNRTSSARDKKAEKAKIRRERMAAIAKEKFKWEPGTTLTGVQRRAVCTALMKEYKANDRPTSQDMSNDALILGIRQKKK